MKPRKKTKLCLQCNGVNPISASHCAYCGALLGLEEAEKPNEPQAVVHPPQDMFAASNSFSQAEPKQPAPYHTPSTSHGFVQDRQLSISEESLEKPLYSVFDQPQNHQMGGLEDELTKSPKIAATLQKQATSSPASGFFSMFTNLFNRSSSLSKAQGGFEEAQEENGLTSTLAAGALATGTTLVVLSLVTFIFSQEGKVIISWTEQTAAWIMLASIAMIVFGWKMTSSKESR